MLVLVTPVTLDTPCYPLLPLCSPLLLLLPLLTLCSPLLPLVTLC